MRRHPSAYSAVARKNTSSQASQKVTAQMVRVQGSGKKGMNMVRGLNWRRSCRRLIAAGPNRPCGRMPRTLVPALVDFLNPEP